jgi:hypothetical protein
MRYKVAVPVRNILTVSKKLVNTADLVSSSRNRNWRDVRRYTFWTVYTMMQQKGSVTVMYFDDKNSNTTWTMSLHISAKVSTRNADAFEESKGFGSYGCLLPRKLEGAVCLQAACLG